MIPYISVKYEVIQQTQPNNWSSCSFYCGEPRVERRYKTLVNDTKESRAACPPLKDEPCGNIACTGDNAKASTN